MMTRGTQPTDPARATWTRNPVQVSGLCLLLGVLSGCGGGNLDRDLLQVVKSEYEDVRRGCVASISGENARDFPVVISHSFGLHSDTFRSFNFLIEHGLVDVEESHAPGGQLEEVRYSLTETGAQYHREGEGLCFAEISVDRLLNVSEPFEERGRMLATATAVMSASVSEFTVEDPRFVNFAGSMGARELYDILSARHAGSEYTRNLTFIRNDEGWAIR